MIKDFPFAITISRQFGSGGAYLGQRLAQRLEILYLDREILYRAAQDLKISELDLDSRDERITPRWKSLMHAMRYTISSGYTPPSLVILPTDETLFHAESNIITGTVSRQSAIIVGRAGYHVLRQHPRHLSVFLYADISFRQQRVQELYQLSGEKALKLINRIDRDRAYYLRVFTGQDCTHACQYHLCLNTSIIGFDIAEEIIITALRERIGSIKI
jgi:CMP/dCMP kinase